MYILSYYLIVYNHTYQVIKKGQRKRQNLGKLKQSELGPGYETEEMRSDLWAPAGLLRTRNRLDQDGCLTMRKSGFLNTNTFQCMPRADGGLGGIFLKVITTLAAEAHIRKE